MVMAGIDYRALRGRLRLGQVLDLLGFVPTTHWGAQVRGPCPIHGARSPRSRSFAAHLGRHCWQCCRCGAGGNVLDLWSAVTQLPLYEAALDLGRRLNLEIPRLPARSPPRT
jgi:DNA primase